MRRAYISPNSTRAWRMNRSFFPVSRATMTMDESMPCLNNAMGVKGVGELGTIGATPAVVNAVIDALARGGFGSRAHALQMPLTSERVWRALREAGSAADAGAKR